MRGPQMGFEQDKNGKVIRGKTVGQIRSKRIATTTDWVGALAMGLLVSSLVRFSKQSINVYYKGRPEQAKGFWTGILDGGKGEVSARFLKTYRIGAGKETQTLSNLGMIGTGGLLYSMGAMDKDSKIHLPLVGEVPMPFSGTVDWGKHFGFYETSAGTALMIAGAGIGSMGALSFLARGLGADRLSRGISGTGLAVTKGLVVDVAGASAWNIVSVMATLRFATDLTGFITDEYVIPSMGTDSARWVLGNSLGQLWTSDREALDYGLNPSRRLYEDILDKKGSADSLVGLGLDLSVRSLLAGIFGQNEDGTAKIKALSDLPFSPKPIWDALDKDIVGFSLAMVFLSPLARYGLSNVEFMNIGRKYQAMSEGFEAMGEGLFKELNQGRQGRIVSCRKGQARRFWFFKTGLVGTIEEGIQEPATDMIFLSFFPLPVQVKELLQEAAGSGTGTGKNYKNPHNFRRSLEIKSGIITDVIGKTAFDATQQDAADYLIGKTWADIQGDVKALDALAQTEFAQGTEIIVDESGYERTFEAGGKEWSDFFDVRAKMAGYQPEVDKAFAVSKEAGHAKLTELAAFAESRENKIEKEAIERVVAENVTVNDAEAVAKGLAGRKILAITNKGYEVYDAHPEVTQQKQDNQSYISVNMQYVVEERMATDDAFRVAVVNAGKAMGEFTSGGERKRVDRSFS